MDRPQLFVRDQQGIDNDDDNEDDKTTIKPTTAMHAQSQLGQSLQLLARRQQGIDVDGVLCETLESCLLLLLLLLLLS